jgi:hypothetical protein
MGASQESNPKRTFVTPMLMTIALCGHEKSQSKHKWEDILTINESQSTKELRSSPILKPKGLLNSVAPFINIVLSRTLNQVPPEFG